MSDAALKGPGRVLGFTGTQAGLTDLQWKQLEDLLVKLNPEEFHHGDCVGADAMAHDTVRERLPHCRIVIHPPEDSRKRAFKRADTLLLAKPYLIRNRMIVVQSDELVACPRTRVEELRSGTWDLQCSIQDIQCGYTPKDHSDDLLGRLTDLKNASYDRFQKLVGNARDPICVRMMDWYLKKSRQRTALRRQADNRRQAAADGRFVSKATK